jgi:hypothetical protein
VTGSYPLSFDDIRSWAVVADVTVDEARVRFAQYAVLLDIAVILRENVAFDCGLVATFLLEKAAARDVPVTRAAFRDPDVVRRAGEGYTELEPTTRVQFVPFDEALGLLFALVDEFDIPE